MLDAQHIDLRPMIIDSFAGGGGASTGIEIALGRSPDVAINHSEKALALHAANHPETLHLDSNIWDVDPLTVTGGRPVGLLWASPDCKHFSKAKGGAPRDRNIRDLAWVVVKWAEDVKPDVICMENVEEFPTWGPVDNDGQPIKEFAGQTYELWLKRLRKAGYRCRSRELKACDYGAPTIRKRWFFVARRDGRPIVWPKPTHGDPKSAAVKRGRLLPWRTAAECIDWSLPCPSIFDTSAEIMEKHGLRAIRPLAGNTLARVARGIARYVLEAERPFLVNLTHGARIEDLDDPFRTITGAHRGEKALCAPTLANVANSKTTGRGPNAWDITEPARTVTSSSGFALVAPSITRFNGGATGSDMRDPAPTVTANSYIKRPGGAAPLGIVAPCLASIAHGDSGGRREYPLTETFGVVTAGGICHAIVAPHIMTMRNSQKPFNGIDEPTHTITSGGAGLTLVSPVLTYAQQGGGNRSAENPHHTICASRKDQNSVIIPTLIQTGYGEREGQAPRSLDLHQPLGTVVAGGVKHATIAAFLAQQNTGLIGHDAREPLSTIVGKGCTQTPVSAFIARHFGRSTGHGIDEPAATVTAGGSGKSSFVAPWFAKYYGTGDGARCDEPLHTVTVKDRMGHMQATLEAPPFTAEHEARAREVAAFLRERGAWAGGEFVTLDIDGATFVIVDIGMRMLTPRELFNAQGFPADYVIEGVWEERDDDWHWRAFSKDVQVSCCGNSVCPPLAAAIVSANCEHLAVDAAEVAA